MAITICCPRCGQKYRVSETLAGKRLQCRSCGAAIDVPPTGAAPPLAPPPAPPVAPPTPPQPPPFIEDMRGTGFGQAAASPLVVVMPKSLALSIVLTIFFGPLGMLYSTVPGGIIMLGVNFFIVIVGLCLWPLLMLLLITQPICVIWGAIATASYNKRLLRGATRPGNSRPSGQSPRKSPSASGASGYTSSWQNSRKAKETLIISVSVAAGALLVALIVWLLFGGADTAVRNATRAGAASRATISSTDLESTARRADQLVVEMRQAIASAEAENRGNALALPEARERAVAASKDKIDREFSKLRKEIVQWHFTVEEVFQTGFTRETCVRLKPVGSSLSFGFERPAVWEKGSVFDNTLQVGNHVFASLAKELRPGDRLLIKGMVHAVFIDFEFNVPNIRIHLSQVKVERGR